MPVETFSYVTALNETYPVPTDGLVAGDDHIRGIKATLKASFPNVAGAVTGSHSELNTAVASTINGAPKLADAGAFFKTNDKDGITNPAAGKVAIQAKNASNVSTVVVELTGSDKKSSFKGAVEATQFVGAGAHEAGATVLWWDDALPNSRWAWANGGTVPAADTPALLTKWGNRFGGNGTTTVGMPNLCEVVPIGKSTMGGATARGFLTHITTGLLTSIGALFGSAISTLITANLPPYTPTGTIALGTPGRSFSPNNTESNNGTISGGATWAGSGTNIALTTQPSYTFNGAAQGGTSTAFDNTPKSTTVAWIVYLGPL